MRTVVVTGASRGLGAAVAAALAGPETHVILAVRDVAKGRSVAERLPGQVTVRRLDLADLSSVRSFAAEAPVLDTLINNAGVVGMPQSSTIDGFETQFGVNHLGPFVLTVLLLPRLRDRVVTVSSQAHRQGKLDLADPHAQHRRYDPSAAYAASKLANLLFAFELQRRLTAAGSQVRSIAVHPGLARTDNLGEAATIRLRLERFAQRHLGQSVEAGARPIVHAATADLPGGSFVGPDGFYELRGSPTLVTAAAAARDQENARHLWEFSETTTGVSYP